MDRRRFLECVAGGLLLSRARGSLSAGNRPAQIIPLWPGTPPGGGGPDGGLRVSRSGAQSNIVRPLLTVYTPPRTEGYGVLVAAGGGYKRIETAKEALPAARWLNQRGFTAYILSYRLPAEGWNDGNLVALQDAQRALRIIRAREEHVSVLGFSAGGHLMGMAATRSHFDGYPPQDSIDSLPARADRAALIYPVITLQSPYNHTSTYNVLAGREATPRQQAQLSVPTFVTPQSPPFLLVQASDDPVSDPQNTLIMQAACQRNHVPVELFRYSSGGHGFAMGRPGTPTVRWPLHYQHWLQAWRNKQ
ncbi:alpha/beta hydrolase [Tatumella sp. JGM130]|uniref:alpha/beta hydrolase n=1 Tax=Tatumella sp. JGM130 TaxID=2799797 RepID=UPI001BB0ABD8|nr:alpha/beta hydrolase [Tatumella sp. JGM130]MBS0894996.1 alpha/beta hydrolase [Tatumella sp. JGM130]